MTLLVRTEEDIIRENIEFVTRCKFFIATDHLSVDETADIFKEYEAKGPLLYFFEQKICYASDSLPLGYSIIPIDPH